MEISPLTGKPQSLNVKQAYFLTEIFSDFFYVLCSDVDKLRNIFTRKNLFEFQRFWKVQLISVQKKKSTEHLQYFIFKALFSHIFFVPHKK